METTSLLMNRLEIQKLELLIGLDIVYESTLKVSPEFTGNTIGLAGFHIHDVLMGYIDHPGDVIVSAPLFDGDDFKLYCSDHFSFPEELIITETVVGVVHKVHLSEFKRRELKDINLEKLVKGMFALSMRNSTLLYCDDMFSTYHESFLLEAGIILYGFNIMTQRVSYNSVRVTLCQRDISVVNQPIYDSIRSLAPASCEPSTPKKSVDAYIGRINESFVGQVVVIPHLRKLYKVSKLSFGYYPNNLILCKPLDGETLDALTLLERECNSLQGFYDYHFGLDLKSMCNSGEKDHLCLANCLVHCVPLFTSSEKEEEFVVMSSVVFLLRPPYKPHLEEIIQFEEQAVTLPDNKWLGIVNDSMSNKYWNDWNISVNVQTDCALGLIEPPTVCNGLTDDSLFSDSTLISDSLQDWSCVTNLGSSTYFRHIKELNAGTKPQIFHIANGQIDSIIEALSIISYSISGPVITVVDSNDKDSNFRFACVSLLSKSFELNKPIIPIRSPSEPTKRETLSKIGLACGGVTNKVVMPSECEGVMLVAISSSSSWRSSVVCVSSVDDEFIHSFTQCRLNDEYECWEGDKPSGNLISVLISNAYKHHSKSDDLKHIIVLRTGRPNDLLGGLQQGDEEKEQRFLYENELENIKVELTGLNPDVRMTYMMVSEDNELVKVCGDAKGFNYSLVTNGSENESCSEFYLMDIKNKEECGVDSDLEGEAPFDFTHYTCLFGGIPTEDAVTLIKLIHSSSYHTTPGYEGHTKCPIQKLAEICSEFLSEGVFSIIQPMSKLMSSIPFYNPFLYM